MIQTLKIPTYSGEKDKYQDLSFEYDDEEEYITIYLGEKYLGGISEVDNFKKSIKEILLRW